MEAQYKGGALQPEIYLSTQGQLIYRLSLVKSVFWISSFIRLVQIMLAGSGEVASSYFQQTFEGPTSMPDTKSRKEKKRLRQLFRREVYMRKHKSNFKYLCSYNLGRISALSNRQLLDQYTDDGNHEDGTNGQDVLNDNLCLDELESRSFQLARKFDDVVQTCGKFRRLKHLNPRKRCKEESMIEDLVKHGISDTETHSRLMPKVMTEDVSSTKLLRKMYKVYQHKQDQSKCVKNNIEKKLRKKGLDRCGIPGFKKEDQFSEVKNQGTVIDKTTVDTEPKEGIIKSLENLQYRDITAQDYELLIQLECEAIRNGSSVSECTCPIHDLINNNFFVNNSNTDLNEGGGRGDTVNSLQYRDITPEDYDLLLQLDGDMKSKTLSADELDTIPTFTISIASTADVCSICMELLLVNQKARMLPACMHTFHEYCIDTWLMVQSGRCPLDFIEV